MAAKVLWKGIRFGITSVVIVLEGDTVYAHVADNYGLLPKHLWLKDIRPVRFTEVFSLLEYGTDIGELVDMVLQTIDSSYANATVAVYRKELNGHLH